MKRNDTISQNSHEYYLKHKEEFAARASAWKIANSERFAANQARWNAANREKVREYNRAYYVRKKAGRTSQGIS